METKRCSRCKQELPKTEFNKNRSRPDGLRDYCKKCSAEWAAKKHRTAQGRRYQRVHNRMYNKEIKRQVIEHYSKKEMCCRKCGYSDMAALSIDHVNGGGRQHRMQLGKGRMSSSVSFYLWLRKNKYPPDFQVLCMNCQFVKKEKEESMRYSDEDAAELKRLQQKSSAAAYAAAN